MKKQQPTKIYMDPSFLDNVIKIDLLDITIEGDWVFEFDDYPEAEEYSLTLIEKIGGKERITLWFTSIDHRTKFISSIKSRKKMEQLNSGLDYEKILIENERKHLKAVGGAALIFSLILGSALLKHKVKNKRLK